MDIGLDLSSMMKFHLLVVLFFSFSALARTTLAFFGHPSRGAKATHQKAKWGWRRTLNAGRRMQNAASAWGSAAYDTYTTERTRANFLTNSSKTITLKLTLCSCNYRIPRRLCTPAPLWPGEKPESSSAPDMCRLGCRQVWLGGWLANFAAPSPP
ncbi:hypothetical protein FN846DRAFT_995276 [Sphaerosporella brunnea]|uniref:Uncharacterized protein n=1 Tax=Sphaerosporella brunnea TaxID=1250544 RepID=A0A5J5F6K6_9PEZI|nr:hypothetical protein FN846DRAFT_995276 [Sphaerosporella brunnea]